MSLADVHFIVLGCREIQVASLGEDQLSLGATAPPREAMVEVICAWRAGKRWFGGSFGGGGGVGVGVGVGVGIEVGGRAVGVGGGDGGFPVVVVVVGGGGRFIGGELAAGGVVVGEDDAVLADVGEELGGQGDDARADA